MSTPEELKDCLEKRLDPALDMLRRMVSINSYTLNRAGVNEVGRLTAEWFGELGFEREFVPSAYPNYGDHLVLTRRGRSARTVQLVSHLDTVFSPEEEARDQFAWRRDGDRLYGPGTMDIKGGTVMMHLVLSGLRRLAPDLFDEITWVGLWNSSEEVLSPDFGRLCLERKGPAPVAGLVFEAGGKKEADLAVVTARKGRATFRITAEGRGAHAGSRHERGANAVVQLANVVGSVAALTDYSRGLTFNVGVISGGTVVNRVPHLATAEVEMRAFTVEAYQAGMQSILALNGRSTVASQAGGHRCQTSVQVTGQTPPWPDNPGTRSLFRLWQETAQAVGLRLAPEERGGISDGNYLWASMPTLDGLGPYGDHAHCSERSPDGSKDQEYADASSFVPRASLHVLALLRLLRAGQGPAPSPASWGLELPSG